MKSKLILLPLLLLLLGGCSNNIFNNEPTITSIEIMKFPSHSPSPEEYEKQEGEIILVITSKEEIDRIIHSIERAESESIENANIALPNYLMLFKNKEQVILSLGYYPNIIHSQDHFLHINEDKIYKTNSLDLIE